MPHNEKHHTIDGFQSYFLFIMILTLIVLLLMFIAPFLSILVVAAVISTALYPLHRLFARKMPPTLSAILSLILVTLFVLTPLFYFFFFVAGQAANVYGVVSQKVSGFIVSNSHLLPAMLNKPPLSDWITKWGAYNPISVSDLVGTAKDIVGGLGKILLAQATVILTNLPVFFLNAIIFFLAMFYFLRDGEKLVRFLKSILPLSEEYRVELFVKLKQLSHGIIYGFVGSAVVQGVAFGIGLVAVGIGDAAFWSLIAAIVAVFPFIGSSTVVSVIPCIALFVAHRWFAAVLLMLWAIVVEYWIKPYLMGVSAMLQPFAMMLMLIGGAFVFGFKGMVFGPFVLMLTLSFLHIYQLEYKGMLNSENPEN